MQLRSRSKDVDDGASTSTSVPLVDLEKEEYIFPEHLIKDQNWRQQALSNKCDKQATTSMNLALVFDFVSKFNDAFNLTKFSEEELDEAISASISSSSSYTLVRLVVELLSGFTSIDSSHQMRMYHRNRVYRETNNENYNLSLWEFFDHDWKVFTHGAFDLENFFASSKERADLFKFNSDIRAVILYELCQYRLACFDAQNVIDSTIDESESPMGDQLRTSPIGGFNDEKYYYLGGTWLYRWKSITIKHTKRKSKVSNKRSVERRNTPKKSRKETEDCFVQNEKVDKLNEEMHERPKNGVVSKKMVTEIETNSAKEMSDSNSVVEDCEQSDCTEVNGQKPLISNGCGKEGEPCSAQIDKMNELHDGAVRTIDSEKHKINNDSVNDSSNIEDTINAEEYFECLRVKNFLWEVVCKTEDHLHFLIEYFRENRRKALVKTLIDVVLPSVQKIFSARRIAEKKRNRFVPIEVKDTYLSSQEIRHSRRLEQKKIEREKRLESREERAKQREQRIEHYNLTRRLKMGMSEPSTGSSFECTRNGAYGHSNILTNESYRTNRLNGKEKDYRRSARAVYNGVNSSGMASHYGDDYIEYDRNSNEQLPIDGILHSGVTHSYAYSKYGLMKNTISACRNGDVSASAARTRPIDWRFYRAKRSSHYQQFYDSPNECESQCSYEQTMLTTYDEQHFHNAHSEEIPSLNTSHNNISYDFCNTSNMNGDNPIPSAVADNDQNEPVTTDGFVDYPAFKDGQLRWFRIVEPTGTRIILQRNEPFKEHDYFLPTVEQIVTNKWKFLVEPIDESSSDQKTEFTLQFGQQTGKLKLF
ncbi:unnamed protein product [Anisakis simplex]|uniref:DDT domain-containing protein n=1 Tax=Anisakis simplex TaxID=6269 RepID=A0A158PMS7_ANISI|nr:unnamed protein product [Anisakis simplex]